MFAQKNKSRISDSQVFKTMQSEYEPRVNQLEKDVYECCRMLKQDEKVKDSTTMRKNHREMEKYVSWKFDMRDFPMENIRIQLKDELVYVRAYYKNLNIKREILMPQNVDASKLTALLTPRGILTISVPIVLLISDDQKMRF
ncbi:uncharacterized protein LOC122616132 [Drosophila teissieri]|uniref:uncharacterized protein LOC122616132 n=1 Tax=Drosophila teissieri TaxID=7243 RepID=UPI001CBA478B|nr:uncharacterized protein LOC122616132 [Drosophila teissieri]